MSEEKYDTKEYARFMHHMKEAENHISTAVGIMGNIHVGGGTFGWGEYQTLVKIMLSTRSLTDRLEYDTTKISRRKQYATLRKANKK